MNSPDEERVFLTKEQAISMLPDGDSVHTIVQCGFGLIGADWSKEKMLSTIDKHRFELSGKITTSMGHGMTFRNGTGYVFVETKKEGEITNG